MRRCLGRNDSMQICTHYDIGLKLVESVAGSVGVDGLRAGASFSKCPQMYIATWLGLARLSFCSWTPCTWTKQQLKNAVKSGEILIRGDAFFVLFGLTSFTQLKTVSSFQYRDNGFCSLGLG